MKHLIVYAKITSFVVVFLILQATSVVAQSQEQQFRGVFDRETRQKEQAGNYANFRHTGRLSFFPDTLPAWFFQPPPSNHDSTYAIGISDPDLPYEEAYQQAYSRAMVMAVLCHSPRIAYFRDMFTSYHNQHSVGNHRQRFDTYFRITASEPADSSMFREIASYFTRYNESIVLISYTQHTEKAMSRITASASVLYIEAHIGGTYEPQASVDLESDICHYGDKTETAAYNSTRKGNRITTSSVRNGKPIYFPLFVYRYANPAWAPFTQPMVSYHGLWGIFLSELLEHLTHSTEQTSLRIRTLQEQTKPRNQNITREVAVQKARIILEELDLKPSGILFETQLEKTR